jgi:hypothetical protein
MQEAAFWGLLLLSRCIPAEPISFLDGLSDVAIFQNIIGYLLYYKYLICFNYLFYYIYFIYLNVGVFHGKRSSLLSHCLSIPVSLCYGLRFSAEASKLKKHLRVLNPSQL